MIYYSTLSDDYLWKLIFCGKQKKKGKKKKKTRIHNSSPFFKWAEQKQYFNSLIGYETPCKFAKNFENETGTQNETKLI